VNGARALLQTLVGAGVEVCFANPGTSELQFVAALEDVPDMRGVLTLFEGVATGAADGYARISGGPAATLLHLGPGLSNGSANLHNARRARSPLVNLVGDHATTHHRLDAPLESDVVALARPVSDWVRVSPSAAGVAQDGADAVAAACGPPGRVATLVLPADVSWDEAPEGPAAPLPTRGASRVPANAVDDAARALSSGDPAVILLGGAALTERPLMAAAAIAHATGARLMSETFPARLERGAGLPAPERFGYYGQPGLEPGTRHLVLVDARRPVSFFAYPDQPGDFVPAGCGVHVLAEPYEDVPEALEALAEALGTRPGDAPVSPASRPDRPTGTLDASSLAAAVGALLPEGAIVVDESITAGLFVPGATVGAPRHDWLALTGGAIGQGTPVATGAAVAAPTRRVLDLQADGSAMYTVQSLWTQAREGLDVTTVILANRSYAILGLELGRVGARRGDRSGALLDLDRPDLDFVSLATGLGVPAGRATTADELVSQLDKALAEPGPSLIEAVLPHGLG